MDISTVLQTLITHKLIRIAVLLTIIACVISFFMTGYRSIFPSQVLSSNKTQSVVINKGEEVENYTTHYNYRTRKMMVSGKVYAKRLFQRTEKK